MPSILWKRIDRAGHEFCSLTGSFLNGTALIEHKGMPCCLNYEVICDETWRTRSSRVIGFVGKQIVEVNITVAPEGVWRLNGEVIEPVTSCLDVDLNFSPSTNTLPIRRLDLAIGEEAEVRAAWLRFPSFELEPIMQNYRRLDESAYQYSSGSFTAEVRVNAADLVTNYEGFCEAIAESP